MLGYELTAHRVVRSLPGSSSYSLPSCDITSRNGQQMFRDIRTQPEAPLQGPPLCVTESVTGRLHLAERCPRIDILPTLLVLGISHPLGVPDCDIHTESVRTARVQIGEEYSRKPCAALTCLLGNGIL